MVVDTIFRDPEVEHKNDNVNEASNLSRSHQIKMRADSRCWEDALCLMFDIVKHYGWWEHKDYKYKNTSHWRLLNIGQGHWFNVLASSTCQADTLQQFDGAMH